MCASQPHCLNCASIHSALTLSCGEPTWFGSEDSRFSQSRISLALNIESKRCSSWRCCAALAAVKPSIPPPDDAGGAGGAAAPAAHVNDRHANASPNLCNCTRFIANPSDQTPGTKLARHCACRQAKLPFLRRRGKVCIGQSSWLRPLRVSVPTDRRTAGHGISSAHD